MINDREQRQRSVKLFVRGEPELGVETQKEAVLNRLSELHGSGTLADYDVRVWGNAIRRSGPLEGTEFYEDVFSHLEAFQRWAERNGVSMNYDFKERTIHCSITNESYSVVSLPSMCLAVYEGDALRCVYPYREGTDVHPICEFLDELDADESPFG